MIRHNRYAELFKIATFEGVTTSKRDTHRLVCLSQGNNGTHAPPVLKVEVTEVHDSGHYQAAIPGSHALVQTWAEVPIHR
jgi:hypothetical protein